MIDLHLHVLPGIDDGSQEMQESLEMIKKLSNLGFSGAFCTSHFIADSEQDADNKKKSELRNQLQKEIEKAGINFQLYAGNEIYIDPKIVQLLKSNKASTLGGIELKSLTKKNERNALENRTTKCYVLFELPFYTEVKYLRDVVFEMKANGIIPILAHPERYSFLQKDKKRVSELLGMGIKLQCNYGSIVGQYGRKAKRVMRYLLKNHLVSFLGTDIHHEDSSLFENFEKAKKKIIKITGEEEFVRISRAGKEII